MKQSDLLFARIEAILSDIEYNFTPEFYEPTDREAFDIVCRIERSLLTKKIKND